MSQHRNPNTREKHDLAPGNLMVGDWDLGGVRDNGLRDCRMLTVESWKIELIQQQK